MEIIESVYHHDLSYSQLCKIQASPLLQLEEREQRPLPISSKHATFPSQD